MRRRRAASDLRAQHFPRTPTTGASYLDCHGSRPAVHYLRTCRRDTLGGVGATRQEGTTSRRLHGGKAFAMLTWLEVFCRRTAETVDEKWHGGDPRKALAYHIGQEILAFRNGIPPENILSEVFTALLVPFIAEFMPSGASLTLQGKKPARPLGLLLTRPTANLLSGANPISMSDDLWREKLGLDRAVYVDIPHGAILMDAGGDTNDIIQLRAILAAPYLPPDNSGQTLFVAQMTDRGSERGRGRLGGVLLPDGLISRFGSPTMASAVDWTMKPPFAHSMLERAVLGRAGTFLRLALAYHFFGPEEAREAIAATPPARLRAGKPRKDDSLFALTRLRACDEVGRPKNTIPSSWSLTSRQEVMGHFKLQAYGPQQSLRRMIWVDPYQRGPDDAPIRPQGHRI
jgi:hypothetical protein